MYIVYCEDGAISFVLILQKCHCVTTQETVVWILQSFSGMAYRLCETFPLQLVVLFSETKLKIIWAIVCKVASQPFVTNWTELCDLVHGAVSPIKGDVCLSAQKFPFLWNLNVYCCFRKSNLLHATLHNLAHILIICYLAV
jgi:hypothetical protein